MSTRSLQAGPADAASDLELLFGDPHEDGPFAHTAVIADDDARRSSSFAEAILDEWGAAGEFVPLSLGGRWGDTADLVARLRPVFRRDPSVGFGHALASLTAAVGVWVAGSAQQQSDLARRLLRGERIAAAFAELEHGDRGAGCIAEAVDGRWRVTGGEQIVLGRGRTDSVLILARTGDDAEAASLSLLLWTGAASPLTTGGADRVLTAGLRGAGAGALRFDGAEVPASAMIGAPGTGGDTARIATQVTRAIVPALAIASVEAALHEAILYARSRLLYGATVLDIPHARALYADALADTLLADAFSTAIVRSLHDAPDESFLLSAAGAHLIPRLLSETMRQLSVLASSTFYARLEPYALIEKLVRDLAGVQAGLAGGGSALLDVVSILPTWARQPLQTQEPDLRLLAAPRQPREPDFAALGLDASADPLGATLEDPGVREALAARAPGLLRLVEELAERYAAARALARSLTPHANPWAAPAATFDLAREIALHLSAAAVLGMWASLPDSGEIGADALIAEACLRRVLGRLDGRHEPLPDEVVERLVRHGEQCAAGSRSVGLHPVPVYPSAGPHPAAADPTERTRS
ncbi:hypothetical protein AB1K54_01325 [Microbacterium sp. BWT-B31]|uniref:hypothetical protein n=1 Tax=Microbacterium sp. BWT-B31 TaxID=3232072 RepID=UPI003526DE4C